MGAISDAPKWLKPFIFHGVDIEARDGSSQAIGECPFCGKARKFYVDVSDSQWDCKSCGLRGNVYNFLNRLHEQSMHAGGDYEELAAERGLCYSETLTEWGVVRSVLTGEWLVPAYNAEGAMNQLYRYCWIADKQKHRLFATPELGHGIYGMGNWDASKPNVAVTEGPWDGMIFHEVIKRARPEQESYYAFTSNEMGSLYASTNVIAAPGVNVFPEHWAPPFSGKHVWFLYDNQHPRVHEPTGITQPPIGWEGMKRATLTLITAEEKPATVNVLTWGDGGWTSNYPDGYDVRDFFTSVSDIADRVRGLGALMANVLPFPEDWMPGRTSKAVATGGSELQPLPCNSFADLEREFRKAMKWNPGLRKGLVNMLAVVISTTGTGSQLWMKFMSPPSTGKTSLCEAVSVAGKYMKAMSHLTGFFSGVKNKEAPDEDMGLISKLHNKTLVTKDADTLLSSDNLRRILSEARDIYDRTARTHFKTGSGRDYGSVNMTWILCGTGSIMELDSSELGERFLTCIMMKVMEEEFERSVQRSVMKRVIRNRGLEANGKPETRNDPLMIRAMALAGGYVEYLRENATGLQEAVNMSEEAEEVIMDLALLVAFMRARPSKRQQEIKEREFSPRLTEQLGRLAICTAAVLNKREVDAEVLAMVKEVALDSCEGITFEMCKAIVDMGDKGIDPKNLAMFSHETMNKATEMLKFLREIEVVEVFVQRLAPGVMGKPKWRLTPRVRRLWAATLGGITAPEQDMEPMESPSWSPEPSSNGHVEETATDEPTEIVEETSEEQPYEEPNYE